MLNSQLSCTWQALASFKRQQEQSFQEQSALAVEAREAQRQELRDKIAQGQAAKKQRLEQAAGASGVQEAAGSQAGPEQAQEGQEAGEQQEARERGPGGAGTWEDGRMLGVGSPLCTPSEQVLPSPSPLPARAFG